MKNYTWIETKTELPSFVGGTSNRVLIYIPDIGTQIGLISAHNMKWHVNGVYFYKDDVTHWQPLPDKPDSN